MQNSAFNNLNKQQHDLLISMDIGKPYRDVELPNGKTLKVLCDKGYLIYTDFYDELPIIMIGHYTPWKYGKTFTRVR